MSALLLAGTTSFVSCKDNVDDVETGIRFDMGTMNNQIKTLEQRIAVLEAQDMGVEQLKKDLEALKAEVAKKADKTYVDEEIKKLQDAIDKLAEQIKKASSTMVTGVVLQETLDCVVGTINLPGFNPAFLAAYVGENKTGVPELPISGPDYNVDPDGNYLKASELPTDEDMFVGNSGKNAYLINGTGNAGKIYFTINPRKVDPSLLQFSLINSTGEESPIKLSDVQKSEHLITFAIGKHGNGLTRADGDEDPVLIAPAPGTDVQNEKTYLYEANATCALEGIEKIHFDYTKFGYNNLWDAGSALLGTDQGPDAEAQNLYGRFQYLAKQIKAKNVKNTLEASLKILQDFYNGVYQQREKLQKQALRVSWNDGENDVISGFDITTVTINPLNYKQMILADKLLAGASWNIMALNGIVGKIVGAIQARMPNITWSNIAINVKAPTAPQISGKDIYLVATTDGSAQYTWAYDPVTNTWNWYDSSNAIVTDQKFDLGTDTKLKLQTFLDDLAASINKGADLTSVNNQAQSIISKYNAVKNASTTGVMTRVNNYLNKVSTKLMGEFDNQPCWKLTEPTLLFESKEGIGRMYPFGDADGTMRMAAGKYTFIMTSLTEEYIVPVYRKYIALIYGGKVKFAQSFAGNQKIVQIEIPNEACEIVYQTCDYYGNVVTKRYPINRY
jgi:soluble cytochrome b562